MAPELLRPSSINIRRCDMQAADVYSFAMIVYEISTRKYPFEDEMEKLTATGSKSLLKQKNESLSIRVLTAFQFQ